MRRLRTTRITAGQGGADRTGRKPLAPLGRARRVALEPQRHSGPPPLNPLKGAAAAAAPRALGPPAAPARPRDAGAGWAAARAGLGAVARRLARVARMSMVAAIVLALGGAVSALLLYGYYYFSDNDYFLIKRHDIRGIFRVSRQEVLAATGLDKPTNYLSFDAPAAARGLKTLPWVEEASVVRSPFPDGVTIRVSEYRPRAVVSLDRLYHMDARGRPFKSLEPGENPGRPVVTGFTLDELLNEGPLAALAVGEILDLMDALDRRSDYWRLDDVSEIRRDPDIGVTLFGRRAGVEARLGFGPFAEKLARLGRVTEALRAKGHLDGVTHMNLECAPRVTVRWASGKKPPDVGLPEGEDAAPEEWDGEAPPPPPSAGPGAGAPE